AIGEVFAPFEIYWNAGIARRALGRQSVRVDGHAGVRTFDAPPAAERKNQIGRFALHADLNLIDADILQHRHHEADVDGSASSHRRRNDSEALGIAERIFVD